MSLIVRICLVLLITIALSNALTIPQLCASKNFGYKIQDPEDCHSFYVCLGSLGQFTLDCGSGYRFNETEQKCVKGKCPPCPCLRGYNENSVHITELISTLPYHVVFLQQDGVPQEFTNLKENVQVSEDQEQNLLSSNSKILKAKQNINLLEIFPNSADIFGISNSSKNNKVFLGKSAALSISAEKYDGPTITQSNTDVTTTSDRLLPNEIIKDTIGEKFDLTNDFNNMPIPTEYTTQILTVTTEVPNTKIYPDLSSTTTEISTTPQITTTIVEITKATSLTTMAGTIATETITELFTQYPNKTIIRTGTTNTGSTVYITETTSLPTTTDTTTESDTGSSNHYLTTTLKADTITFATEFTSTITIAATDTTTILPETTTDTSTAYSITIETTIQSTTTTESYAKDSTFIPTTEETTTVMSTINPTTMSTESSDFTTLSTTEANTPQTTMLSTESTTETSTESATEPTTNESKTTLETTTSEAKIESTSSIESTTVESTTVASSESSTLTTSGTVPDTTTAITTKATTTESATEPATNESKTTLETTTSEVKIESTSTIESTIVESTTVTSSESTTLPTSETVPDTTTAITTTATTTESITQNSTTTAVIAEITTTEISITTSTTKTCTSTTACTSTTNCPTTTTMTATRVSTISCPTTTTKTCTATETTTTKYATTTQTRSTTTPNTTTSTTVTCSTTTTKTCTTIPTTTTSTTITCTLPHTTSTCASKASGSGTSEIEYLCRNKENGYFVKDSKKCKRYYTCYNKRAYPQVCPGKFHFDDKSKMCNYPELVNCQDEKETPQNTRPLTVGLKHRLSKQQTASTAISFTPIDCKILKSGTFIRDPSNCNKYYVCLNDNAVALYCPRGQYFDIEKLVCNIKTLVKNCLV